jgi:hypothetical protein
MRVMFTVAVLLSGIACISKAEAQVCGDRDCNRCLVYAGGKCIKRGADPACEARKKKCLEQRKFDTPASRRAPNVKSAPKSVSPRGQPRPPTSGDRAPYVRSAPKSVAPGGQPQPPTSTGGAPNVKSAPKSVAPQGQPQPPTSGDRAPGAEGARPQSEIIRPPAPRLVPARIYLRAADIPPPSIGAYGVVAFRSKPTPANRQRLVRTCIAYRASLPPQNRLPSSIPPIYQMLTIWPLDEPDASEALKDDCDFAVDHYDLAGGILAIQDASHHQGTNLEGIGPFLIGWSPSNTRGVPDKVVLVFDLSSLESQASFDEAFLIWQKKIVENPALWVSGFSAKRIRLALRDFVDHYGSDVVKLWGGKN